MKRAMSPLHFKNGKPKYEIADNGCWVWTAAISDTGYGNAVVDSYRTEQAHRASWKMHRGPIPAGMVIDHLCRNTACVNPDHLEPVLPCENVRRTVRIKLNFQQVESLRRRRKQGERVVDLAAELGMNRKYLGRMLGGHYWANASEVSR